MKTFQFPLLILTLTTIWKGEFPQTFEKQGRTLRATAPHGLGCKEDSDRRCHRGGPEV